MNTHSRQILPPIASETTALGAVVLCLSIVGGLGLAFWAAGGWLLLPAVGFVLLVIRGTIEDRRHTRMMAESRRGEDIGTFARSFDYRSIDTRLLRATYEELDAHIAGSFPIRRDDRLLEDLRIDEDDVDDLFVEIARRCRRSVESTETNPMYGRASTVGELVLFLSYQPELTAV